MTEKSGPEGSYTGSGVPAERATAEAKRLSARRRFLLGGAAALPAIVTLGQKEAWAASAAVCQSLNMSYDKRYVWKRLKEQYGDDSRNWPRRTGLAASLYCDPGRRWS